MRTGKYTGSELIQEFKSAEFGVIATAGISVEVAKYLNNPEAGAANADHFNGTFHTIQGDAFVASGSLYIGEKDEEHGFWVGGTFGIPTLGFGAKAAKVDWEYEMKKKIDLDDDYSPFVNFIGECLCRALIIATP
jgi:hypothetical protein